MTTLYPGVDLLGPRAFTDTAQGLVFELKLTSNRWQTTRFELLKALEDYLEGMFDITVVPGDPGVAEFKLWVEAHEVDKGRAIIQYLTTR